MKRPSLRGLLGRVAASVIPSRVVGTAWKPEFLATAEDFEGQTYQAFQLIGAGLVQSWEIQLAELGRLWSQSHPDMQADLVQRWSDCLVPVEAPVQALGRVVQKSLERGRAKATETGLLADYTSELEAKFAALPPEVEKGWIKCTEHLEMCFEVLDENAPARAGFVRAGDDLVAELAALASRFSVDVAAVAESESLSKALFLAIDAYQEGVVRAIEFGVVGGKECYVAALTA